MSRIIRGSNFRGVRWGFMAIAVIMSLVIAGSPAWGAPTTFNMSTTVLGAGGQVTAASQNTSPLVQQFEDVPPTNPFYDYTNNIYVDGIVSGYPCGGVGEPCNPPGNLPYYRPNNNVTRGQMSKFLDLGRRSIADATGTRLQITNPTQIGLIVNSTASDSIDANNASGNEAIQAICSQAGQNCWAFYSSAASGDYAAVLSGGRGVSVTSSDSNYAALDANTAAATSYSINGHSDNYRSVLAQNASTSWYGLYVDTPAGSTVGAHVNGDVSITGNLSVSGSKGGYVVDIMQSADSSNLQPGDVVTIVGNSTAVVGEIPVVTIKKASSAYDTGVVGIVDQAVYVPDAATKATYQAEQAAVKDVLARRQAAAAQADAAGTKFDPGSIPMPAQTISDDAGTVHSDAAATVIATSSYANVVTLGAYKGVKVDASFGAVHAGDLLVSSPNPGYAMKATDRAQANGAVIGKALGELATGTGLIPVMVTLK
jgi:hypothetical protein